jgi:hypothetical protein
MGRKKFGHRVGGHVVAHLFAVVVKQIVPVFHIDIVGIAVVVFPTVERRQWFLFGAILHNSISPF